MKTEIAMPDVVVASLPLSSVEAGQLQRCESIIRQGLDTFYEVGSALAEIRTARLYRAEYKTFEDYCRQRWAMSRRHVNRLIESSQVINNLGPIGPIPSTESQARELAVLSPEAQRAAWQEVIDTAPERGVTAAHVKEVVENLKKCPDCNRVWMADLPYCPYCNLSATARIEGLKKSVHVSHNSGDNEWYTPVEYVDAARGVMGAIDLDPASSKAANVTVGAAKYYSISDSGLTKEWSGRVWMNPPYASELVGKFTSKLTQHYLRDEVQEALVLVNNATETVWFQEMAQHANAICLLRGRVRFWGPDGQTGAPLQGQVILYFGDKKDQFHEHFQAFGLVVWR